MHYNSTTHITTLHEVDYEKLIKITKHLINNVFMPHLGLYNSLTGDQIWMSLVWQYCVVSGKRLVGDLKNDEKKLREFENKLSFRKLLLIKNNRKKYISEILQQYKATSFYNKQAERIEDVLNAPEVFSNDQLILLKDVDHSKQSYDEIRNILTHRIPHFKLKSASEFMIENGLSIDVMGFNTRIVEVLTEHFNLNVDNQKVQSSKRIYESVENALRIATRKMGVPLSYMSRMLYHYSDKDTISYILEDL
jgi:thermostable 8-oxoguanine DNA glycosylase